MSRAKEGQQPRAITPDLVITSEERYRAGLHLELQKFTDPDRVRQLYLSEAVPPDKDLLEQQVEATGLDLSVWELKAVHALQLLLEEEGAYDGKGESKEISSSVYVRGTVPTLTVPFTRYFEAYSLHKRESDGRYSSRQRDKALEALDSLSEPRRIAYRRKYWKGKKEVSDVITGKVPLLQVWKGYKAVEDSDAVKLMSGEEPEGVRATHLVIEFGPIWMDQIESFYTLKPKALLDEVQDVLGRKRYSPSIHLFLDWLMTKPRTLWRIGREGLAEKIGLGYLMDSRHWSKLDERLEDAIQVALETGFLLDYSQDEFGVFTFHLSPERCSRVRKPQAEDSEED